MITHPMSQTTAGFHLSSEPYLLIEDQSPAAIGAAVRSALAAYRTDVRTPLRHEYPVLPVSALQKEMSRHRGARLIDIEKKEAFAVVPHMNGGGMGPNRGYHELADKKIVLPLIADDAALGQACLNALDLCEEVPNQSPEPTAPSGRGSS
jgi:hypothetical protein